MPQTRRNFLKTTLTTAAGAAVIADSSWLSFTGGSPFKISLAEWSLHRALFGGKLSNLDFPVYARKEFGIGAVEYVSQFFNGTGKEYLSQLLKITQDNGITNVLIMVDGEGDLGNLYEPARIQAVERHFRWVDAAKFLGCHSIRVNARGEGSAEQVAQAAVDGLGRLTEYGAKNGIGVIVENHGGYSSDGKWLSGVISKVNSKYCGTLPDFGNFCITREMINGQWSCTNEYDRYQGMKDLMPFAKGVSAKSHAFDADGNEVNTDYRKMLQIAKDAGFIGYVGIEYEGNDLPEDEGVRATKKLLEKVFAETA